MNSNHESDKTVTIQGKKHRVLSTTKTDGGRIYVRYRDGKSIRGRHFRPEDIE